MISIAGKTIPQDSILSQYTPDSLEEAIIKKLVSNSKIINFTSLNQLKFEINLRIRIIKASRDLNKSGMSFKVFRESICNDQYWIRSKEGGFSLKNGIKPSQGIMDIFNNGWKYGTECATAIIILYYKAVLDLYGDKLFNKTFPNIYLMDWKYSDITLGVTYFDNPIIYLPGDCRYFKNPDVDPKTPEAQGQNAIDLSDGTYYGHGPGISTAPKIIASLNRRRKKGSTTSAYLLDSVTLPDFNNLANLYDEFLNKV